MFVTIYLEFHWDYFKEEVIPWAWEFQTSEKWLELDPNRLYVTYYPEDPETKTLWMDKLVFQKIISFQ